MPVEFASRGYQQQICFDFSTVVVELMAERHSNVVGIEWKHMDVRNLVDVASDTIEVAFNKSTLDAMIYGCPWGSQEVRANTGSYLKEAWPLYNGSSEGRGFLTLI